MYYGGSRSSYNFSSDLPFSSLTPRNPSIQRVLNNDYGLSERSRSPVRDYGSSMSRFTAFRPLPGVLSRDTSPTVRRREAISSHESSRSSPVSFHNDDLGYSSKPRNYYDFPSTTTGLFTSYTSTIKKPKRIDYSDYLRPVLSDRPMLKSGYCPRSRDERDSVSNPIVRERKLIKFRETSDDVLEKIRRKISWDLPEEISSPLIDEMKKNADSINENCVSEQIRSREGSLSRRGSKDIASPLSGSPRPSISRRSSGDQSLDRLAARRKQSSRSNSLIGASIDGIFDTLDSKAPIPPPRKKSIGSTHRVKKPRKSSIDILLSEEKTLNYSKVADDIRRSREISESLKKLANDDAKDETEMTAEENNALDGTCMNELKTIEESSEISDRGRRRRRRESEPEPEEKPPETRRRCRSRFRPDESAEISVEYSQTVEKFEDETPRPVSRMHRKSVKYKPDALPHRRLSKGSDIIPNATVVTNQKTSPVVDSKDKTISQESNKKCDPNSILGKEVSKTLAKHKLIPDNKTKPVNDKVPPKSEKLKFDQKGTSSLTQLEKKSINAESEKISKLEPLINKSESETRMPPVRDFAHKHLRTDKDAEEKAPENKYSKIDKTAEIQKKPEKILDLKSKGTDVNTSEKPTKIVSKIADVKPVKSLKTENREKEAKTNLELPSLNDNKLSETKKDTEGAPKIETNDQTKSSKIDSKIKNTFTNKVSKIGSNESEVKNSNTVSEDAIQKLDMKDSFPSTSTEKKETKSISNTSISKVEAKPDAQTFNQVKLDSSPVEKKVLKTDIKKSGIENDIKAEKEVSDQTVSKSLRKFDDNKLRSDKQDISRTPPIESQEKSSEVQKVKTPTESTPKTKLPENKEVEEIVVVCKLPKKNELRKKSIPNEPMVIVSIKNSEIKIASLSEDSSDVTKDLSTEHIIIPTKQSMDSKLEICDTLKTQGISSSEEPEINVTHTVVLKPKTRKRSVEVQNACTKEKNENLRLKPIPDVIKNTVNAGAKQDSDISDIVKSTLSKADDQSKTKSLPVGIKTDISTVDVKTNLATSKTQISNEKLNISSLSVTHEKDKKLEFNEKVSKVSKDATPEKNSSAVKKSTSAIFSNKKDETESQNLKVKKSSSTGFDYDKNEVSDTSEMKPDLIQMTAISNNSTLNKLTEDKISNQNLGPDEKVRTNENLKAVDERNTSKEIQNVVQVKDNIDLTPKIKKDDVYPNCTEIIDSGSERTAVNGDLSNAEKMALHKTEPSLAKNVEGKASDLKKIKPLKTDKIEPEVESIHNENIESAKYKIKISEPSRVLEKDSIDFMKNNKEVNKVSESKIKPAEQNLGENGYLPKLDVQKDLKADESNVKKLIILTPLVNDLKAKRNAAPAYKKSVTVPDIGAILHESDSAEKLVSVSNAQKIKKDEPASLSSGNVPVTLLDTGKQALKSKIEATEALKTSKIRNEELSASNKGSELITSNKLQLPKIGVDDKKAAKEEIKTPKDFKDLECNSSTRNETPVRNRQIDAEQLNDKEPFKTDQRKSANKKQKLNADISVELETESQAEDVTKVDRKHIPSAVETTVPPKVKDNENAAQKSKDILPPVDKTTALKNIMPKIEDVTPLEKEKEKPKSTTDNLKLPTISDTSKLSKNLSQQEFIDSAPVENKLDLHGITRVGSVVKKETALAQNLQVEESSKSEILEKPKEVDLSSDKSDRKSQNLAEENSELKIDSGQKSAISISDHKIDSNTEIVPVAKPNLDRSQVTSKSPKPSKVKQPQLPPVPRQRNRYGLFIRPKDTPKTIVESSSSEESETETESESESESSEEEPTPVVNKTTHLTNGRSPDRVEKSRTQSETSNASIYSTLSNSTTCTTFSTSSLDDEYSNRSQDKSKTLKFRKYEIDDFVFLKLLGKGSFGKVLLAELKNSEMYFAIKCLKKDVVLEDDDVESTMIERRVLALGTQHPYMCKLYCTFQTKSYLYFVMEYLNGGDLMFHIQETGRFEEKRAMFYGAEIVSALKFLHKRGIVYRDIKLDNVMLDERGHVRLVDFGMCQCRIYKEECMPSNFCGTPAYIAPEIVLGQKYNQSVDWWSFGVLLYEMLIGRSPFQGTDEDELFWSICNEEPHFPRFLSKEAVHILGLLLVKSPSKRLGMSSCPAGDIKDHAFFSTINWDKIETKQFAPVFKPSVSGPCDTSNFDSSFTTDAATLSPVDSEVLKSMDQEPFHGFSYTNPHLTG